MTDYFYCLEIEGFGSFHIEYNEEKNVYLNKIIFHINRILNEELKQKIEQIFKNILNDIKIFNLYYLEFFFEKGFRYLAIEFNTELHEIVENLIHNEQESSELLKKFDIMNEIIGISYYITDIYVLIPLLNNILNKQFFMALKKKA